MTTENKDKFGMNIRDNQYIDITFSYEIPIPQLDPSPYPNPYPNPYFLATQVHPAYKVSRSRRIALKNIYKFKN